MSFFGLVGVIFVLLFLLSVFYVYFLTSDWGRHIRDAWAARHRVAPPPESEQPPPKRTDDDRYAFP
jgi:hypothetical protein